MSPNSGACGLTLTSAESCKAVVSTFEFQDLVAPGGGPGQADSVHRGLGAAVAEAAHLDRKALANFFRRSCTTPDHAACTKHGAGAQASRDGLHDGWMTVSGHERAESQVMVDVFIAIEIAKFTAAGLLHEDGPRIVSAVVAGHTERNAFEIRFCALQQPISACGARTPVRVLSAVRGTSGVSKRILRPVIVRPLDFPGGASRPGMDLSTLLLHLEIERFTSNLHQARVCDFLGYTEVGAIGRCCRQC